MSQIEPTVARYLARLFLTTKPPEETPEEETDRRAGAEALFLALEPRGTVEASRAADLVALDFMAEGAFRAVNHPDATPDKQPRLRRDALAASRALSRAHDAYRTLKVENAAARPKAVPKPDHLAPREPATQGPDLMPDLGPAPSPDPGTAAAGPPAVPPPPPPDTPPPDPRSRPGNNASGLPTLTWRPPLGGEEDPPKQRFKDRLNAATAYRDPPDALEEAG